MDARQERVDHFVERQRCPICDGSAEHIVQLSFTEPPLRRYLEDFYSPQGGVEFKFLEATSYVLDRCSKCDLIYQRNVPDQFLLHKLYEEWIDPRKVWETYDRDRELDYYRDMAKEVETMIRLVGKSRPKVLDFGMGWGRWCRMAQAFECDAFGCELSEARIQHAQSLGVKVVDMHAAEFGEFDFVNAEQVFEHLGEPLEILKRLREALKSDGVLRISVPNGNDIRRRLRRMDWSAAKGSRWSLNAISPLEHLNCFNNKSLRTLIERAGLRSLARAGAERRTIRIVKVLANALRRRQPASLVVFAQKQ
jgi:2-polyprenyl-3-methyl-5-hydroxy-6-metoxy-1,4-benzoquinol methylase